MKTITVTKLRKNIYKLLDDVLNTVISIEINKGGKKLKIMSTENVDKLQNLISKPNIIKGNPDELVDMSWEKEVNLDLPVYAFKMRWLYNSILSLAILFTILYCDSGIDSQNSDISKHEVVSSDMNFTVAGINYSGYLSQPKQAGSYPVVLLLHGSEGYKDHHKMYANSVAEEAYIVFAYCWFGCGSRASMANVESEDFANVLQYVKGLPNANPNKAGIVGFSAGAAMTIYLGTSMTDLSVIVEYYGINKIPFEAIKVVADNGGTVNVNLSKLTTPILIVQGTADMVTSFKDVQNIAGQLDKLGKTYETLYYTDATHSFNWSDGTGAHGIIYDESAANDAFDGTIAFMDQYLK
jgi:dienelactone hydrolase